MAACKISIHHEVIHLVILAIYFIPTAGHMVRPIAQMSQGIKSSKWDHYIGRVSMCLILQDLDFSSSMGHDFSAFCQRASHKNICSPYLPLRGHNTSYHLSLSMSISCTSPQSPYQGLPFCVDSIQFIYTWFFSAVLLSERRIVSLCLRDLICCTI